MKLKTIADNIQFEQVTSDFLQFVNEAESTKFEPTTDKLIKCIENRRYAGIYYEEEDNQSEVLSGFRLIEPLCFGRGYKAPVDGKVSHTQEYYLRAYVIMESRKSNDKNIRKLNRKSVSKSNRVPYYRLFLFDRIKMFEQIRFKIPSPRDEYNPNDSMIAEILAAAEF